MLFVDHRVDGVFTFATDILIIKYDHVWLLSCVICCFIIVLVLHLDITGVVCSAAL